MNYPAIIFFILFSVTSKIFIDQIKGDSSIICDNCDENCQINSKIRAEEECRFGVYQNYCKRFECAKGPNQTCGGEYDQRGHCGNGLVCSCNKCTGCSTDTLECYNKVCKDSLYFLLTERVPYPKDGSAFPYGV